jgi:hypothetical protein
LDRPIKANSGMVGSGHLETLAKLETNNAWVISMRIVKVMIEG